MPADDRPRPSVLVCALGGTIAMTPTGAGAGGVAPALSAQDLVDAVPGLGVVADVDATSFRQVPGAHLTVDDVIGLAAELGGAPGFAGYVVTQGTDTIEEVGFALDVLWDRPEPVVVTGAMRNPTLAGADGPANLLAAVAVAAAREARGSGCVVVLNDEIHAARFAVKRHTSNPAAFGSPLSGPLGTVSEGTPRLWARLPPPPRLPGAPATGPNRAALVTLTLGDDGAMVRAAADAGYAGLVVEAFGGGHVTPAVRDDLAQLTSRMPVVLASRTGAGEVLRRTYGFAGSERDLLSRGVIPAGMLDGLKARLLLELLLRAGADRAQIVAAMDPGAWAAGAGVPVSGAASA